MQNELSGLSETEIADLVEKLNPFFTSYSDAHQEKLVNVLKAAIAADRARRPEGVRAFAIFTASGKPILQTVDLIKDAAWEAHLKFYKTSVEYEKKRGYTCREILITPIEPSGMAMSHEFTGGCRPLNNTPARKE